MPTNITLSIVCFLTTMNSMTMHALKIMIIKLLNFPDREENVQKEQSHV